jgi:hypothetical protein
MAFTPPGNWATLSDNGKIRAVIAAPDCSGFTDTQVAAYINAPLEIGTGTMRSIVIQEVLDYLASLGQTGWAQVEAALANAGTTAAVKATKRMLQFPATTIPADRLAAAATAMQTAGLLTAGDVTALQARITTHTMSTLGRIPVANGGCGWFHDAEVADVTIARAGGG